jgi:hypothetical protein
VLLLAVLLATACGAVKPTATGGTTPSAPATTSTATSPTAATAARLESPTTASGARTAECSTVQPAPQFPASAPSTRNLVIVWLERPQDQTPRFVVRDVTDFFHPTTVSALENLGRPQFVSATEMSSELVRMPLSGSPRTTVALQCRGMFGLAWSPDGRSAAYVTDLSDSSVSELHLVADGKNRAVSSMPAIPITGCVGSCADFVDMRLLFSPNGAFISFASVWAGSIIRIWSSDGKLVKTIDGDPADARSGPTMSVWSGNSFFFRDKQGIQVWRDGAQSLFLPGVMWIRPKASPAGGRVVYVAKDQSGTPNVFLVDAASAQTRIIAISRSEPAFLNSHLIWYKEERPCVSGDKYPCGSGLATIETGKTYIYDLQDNSEKESTITAVFDVWPHPA